MTRSTTITFGLLSAAFSAIAQEYVISTVAGTTTVPLLATRALDTSYGWIKSLALDGTGNVYFSATSFVYKLDPAGTVTHVAGTVMGGYSGDGGPAINAALNLWIAEPGAGLAVDPSGNVYIADTGNHRIRRVSPDGIITTVVGTGTPGYSGDGGPAINAQLRFPEGVAVDAAGNLFIADSFNVCVRRVSPAGIITTVAGNGSFGSSGDGGPATAAQMLYPVAVTVDGGGNLFIADFNDNRVRRVAPNGVITTVAGTGRLGFSGDEGPATAAGLPSPTGVAVDQAGRLFISEGRFPRVRMVSSNGTITTVAGSNAYGFSGDGQPAVNAGLTSPFGIAVDFAGDLFIADTGATRIRKVSPEGIINTIAGIGGPNVVPLGDGAAATSAHLAFPWSVLTDNEGNILIADSENNRIRRISPDGIINTIAGNGSSGFSGDNGLATNAQLNGPIGLAADAASNLFFIDSGNGRVRKISADGTITTVAGNGKSGYAGDGVPIGDGGPAVNATLGNFTWCNTSCGGLALDQAGSLFIADSNYNRVRKVSPDGIITTVAGPGTSGFLGDGGMATDAKINPTGLAMDSEGNLFIADSGNGRVRMVSPSGIITTVAGGGAYSGTSGDGGPATSARLSAPFGLALDSTGSLFIADPGWNFFTGDAPYESCCDHRIRKVSPDGIITTVAGIDIPGSAVNGSPANIAPLNGPVSVAADGKGNVFVADSYNSAIRMLQPTHRALWMGSVVDAASQHADPVSSGKIVVIYGAGLGPDQLLQNQANNSVFSTTLAGTSVTFNGIAAPILYTSRTQIAAAVPYELSGATAEVIVTYQGQQSNAVNVAVAQAAPSLFTMKQTGWGQASAINADGSVNTAANPVDIGGYISLFATGGGQTSPPGVDGMLGGATPTLLSLPVAVTVGGIPATIQYVGSTKGQVSGLLQINIRIPEGVQPGGYVSVVLQVGDASSTAPIWISVGGS